jgi:cyclopropane-fatty-acyl-phospholipid synthase
MRSRIFLGHVEHARHSPVTHRFRYPVYVYGLDLSEIPEVERALPLFGHNRFGPASLHDMDYLDGSGRSIEEKLRSLLEAGGFDAGAARIILVTSARYFHRVFNPVSFYFVLGDRGDPK